MTEPSFISAIPSSTSGSSDSPPGPRGPRKPTPANWRDLLTAEELTFITQTTKERIADRKARRNAHNPDQPQLQAPTPNRAIKLLGSAGREDYPEYEGGSSAGWLKNLTAEQLATLIKCDIGRLIGFYKLSEPDEKPKPNPSAPANYTGPAVIGKIAPATPITPAAPTAPATPADLVSEPASAEPAPSSAPALADATTETPATPAERPPPTEAEFEALEKKLGTTIGRSANIHDPATVARFIEHAEYCANQKRAAKLRDEFVERTSPYKWPRGP